MYREEKIHERIRFDGTVLTGFVWHMFDMTREASWPEILTTKQVQVSLLTLPEHSKPNKYVELP